MQEEFWLDKPRQNPFLQVSYSLSYLIHYIMVLSAITYPLINSTPCPQLLGQNRWPTDFGSRHCKTPTILNCRSQKLLAPTLLPNKREKGLLKIQTNNFLAIANSCFKNTVYRETAQPLHRSKSLLALVCF